MIDGDKIEKKNLDRQLFRRKHVGENKAVAAADALLSDKQNTGYIKEYLKLGEGKAYDTLMANPSPLVIFCCPDNHAARNACMVIADRRYEKEYDTQVIITGNETTTGSTDLYLPGWKDTKLDLRVRHPEIRSSLDGDPLSPAHCTDHEVLEKDPQLALYNSLTAVNALWMYESLVHTLSFKDSPLFDDILSVTPVSINITPNKIDVKTYGDFI